MSDVSDECPLLLVNSNNVSLVSIDYALMCQQSQIMCKKLQKIVNCIWLHQ